MTANVIVSNGREFYEIPAGDVEAAREDGFYLPSERGMTIVSNGAEVYEISVVDVAQAQRDGFVDLLAARPGQQRPRRKPKAIRRPNRAVLTKTPVRIDTGEEAVGLIDVSAIDIEPAEGEDEERRRELEQELAESAGLRKACVWVCLHMPSWRVRIRVRETRHAAPFGESRCLNNSG